MVGPSRVRRWLVLFAVLAAACGRSAPRLSDLERVDELKARFNADAGTPRLVLLLSPT
ncbi:MAG TPA: hypothetical protein VM364_20875 [Vicinamibacterales bacterium]|nr:hypothetical protein [Vicinamibacterales bacterium]